MDKPDSITESQMRYMLYLLLALVVADGVLSNFLILQNLGFELNPFLKDIVGGDYLLPLKACGALLAVAMLWEIYKRLPRVAVMCSLSFVAFYTAILYWNTFAFVLAVQ